MKSKNLLITMSGGTTTVINATLAGVIETAQQSKQFERILVGAPGIIGILSEQIFDITGLSSAELQQLIFTPGSGFIGTTRVKKPDAKVAQEFGEVLAKHEVGLFINIGGNGTIKQSKWLSKELKGQFDVIALPKTVDNDLGDTTFEQVYFTPGFPSCANYWRHKTWMFNQENMGAFTHDRVLVSQQFGRKTGFITACARLADPERKLPIVLLMPEDQRPWKEVIAAIEDRLQQFGRALVFITEGYDIGDFEKRFDPSGQINYSGSKSSVAQLMVNRLAEHDIVSRPFVPTFDQRIDVTYTSTIDVEAAYGVGRYALKQYLKGEKHFFASICKLENALNGIGFTTIPLEEILDFSRVMPKEWIAEGQFDVTDAFVEYAEPLIGHGRIPTPNDIRRNHFFIPSIYAK